MIGIVEVSSFENIITNQMKRPSFKLLLKLIFLFIFISTAIHAQERPPADTSKGITLSTVNISNKKPKRKKLGISGYTPMVWAGITNHDRNDTYEQARLINIDRPSRLISVNAMVANRRNTDSVTYRLNIYRVKDGFPSGKLVEKSFVKSFSPLESTYTFDLSAEGILLSEDCVVAFEYLLRDRTGKIPVTSLRAKLGSDGGYSRQRGTAEWKKVKGGSASIYMIVDQ